jgi:hypothetical protein
MTYREVAQHFGDRIARGDYSSASNLLSKEMQSATTPAAIQAAVATMTADASGPLQGGRGDGGVHR